MESPQSITPSYALNPKHFLVPIPLDGSNPAHRVLFNRDIFEPIVSALYGMEGPEARNALVRLACTCRGFFYDSVAVLWETMRSIVPLLRTIQGLEWEAIIVDEERGCTQWNIVSPKSLLDCSLVNFAIYAKHIRNIVWTDGGVTPATLQLLAELAENFNGPLLPSLRSFEDHSIRHPPPLSLFPVPVKKLCFTPSNHKLKNHLSTLLAVVPSWSTELQELYIELFRKPDHLPTHEKDGVPSRVTLDRCLQALQKCFTRAIIHRGGYANLRVVQSYVPLPEQHFIALAHLPCLEILHIRFEGLERWRLKRLPALAFQAIRRMVLFFVYGAIASPLARIVENIASNKLEDLDLMFFKATQEDPSLARELFQAMARSAFRNALQYFTFDTMVPMGEDSTRPPQFTMDAFSPLLSLPNLKGLRMLTPMSILTSRDIRALASAWSALQVISFVQGDRSEAAIHVEDLKEFADKCPQLRKIRFKVEAPDHWAPRASLMLDQIKPSLSVVENGCHIIAPGVGALSSGSRAFVSAYLRTLFPAAPFTLGSDPI